MYPAPQIQRLTFGLLAIPLVVAVLAACGSSTVSKSTDEATTPSGDTSALRIGLQGPLTGSQSQLGQGMLHGAELAAMELNSQGGVLGRTVEIIPIDDQADPALGEAKATTAVAQGLDGVVGPYNSSTGITSLPIYIAAGLVPMRLTTADSTAGLGFTLQPMTSQIAPTAVTAITDWAQAGSVAIIVDSTQDYTVSAAETMQVQLIQNGVDVTSVRSITPGAESYAEAIRAALAGAPDLLYVVTYYPEAASIARDLTTAGTDVECMVDYGGFDNGFINDAGPQAAQACTVVGVPSPGDFPNAAALVQRYQATFATAPDSWSPYTYDSVRLFADAVERAGSTQTEALSNALADTVGWTGWTGTVAFEESSGNRIPAPVTVNSVTAEGTFRVNDEWATAVGFTY